MARLIAGTDVQSEVRWWKRYGRLFGLIGAAGILVVTLQACGDDDDEDPTATTAPTTVVEETETETVPAAGEDATPRTGATPVAAPDEEATPATVTPMDTDAAPTSAVPPVPPSS